MCGLFMLSILVALIVLAAAIAAIYLILKNMGEEGIEVAAPGSCKSGKCGVRCDTKDESPVEHNELANTDNGEEKRKEIA